MRSLCVVIMSVIAIVSCGCSLLRSSGSTTAVSSGGKFVQKAPDRSFTGERLRDYLGDGAEEFLLRGFIALTVKQVEQPSIHKPVIVEIYQMNSVRETRNIFVDRKGEEGKPAPVGDEGIRYEGGFLLIEAVRGDRYYRVFTYENALETRQPLILVAQKIIQ